MKVMKNLYKINIIYIINLLVLYCNIKLKTYIIKNKKQKA
jgi:hypothetical protein